MAPIISFSGIASGIDSASLIRALLDRERAARVKPLQTRIADYRDTSSSLGELKTLLSTLSAAADKFRLVNGGALAKSASSGDETVVTASASNAASPGVYNLTVNQLAKNATFSFGSSGETYGSSTAAISGGSAFSSTVSVEIGEGFDTVDISVDETTTLADFASQFNEQTTAATASVVNIGTESSPDYRIVINSNKEGTAQGYIQVTVGAALSARGAFDTNSVDNATNAQFSIAGISGTITRSSNTVSDVLPGVTLALKGTGSTSLSVSLNTSQSAAVVEKFVEAYNELVRYVAENDLVTQEGEGADRISVFGTLSRTSLDENILSSLRGAFSSVSGSGELVNTLADLGITTERDGTLTFDRTTFSSALSSDSVSAAGILERLGERLASIDGTIAQFTRFNGLIDQAVNGNNSQVTSLETRIAEIEASLLQQEQLLTLRFARLEGLIGKLSSQQTQLASLLPAA
jgi:flagellar hook-associated protein 2